MRIGGYEIIHSLKTGKVNIYIAGDGEGGEFSEEALAEVIDKFYKEHF